MKALPTTRQKFTTHSHNWFTIERSRVESMRTVKNVSVASFTRVTDMEVTLLRTENGPFFESITSDRIQRIIAVCADRGASQVPFSHMMYTHPVCINITEISGTNRMSVKAMT